MTYNLPETLEYNGVKIVLADESTDRVQNAISYLLPYGFGKSLQDSVAGLKKKMTEEGKPAAEIEAAILADMAERAEAIFAGTVSLRGPRLSGPEAIRNAVIDEYFKAWAVAQKAKGKSLPSLKSRFGVKASDATAEQRKAVADAIAAIREKYAAANALRIEEETQRRLKAQAAQVDEEIDLELDDAPADDEGDE